MSMSFLAAKSTSDLSGYPHSLADTPGKRLVVDIGGGSTKNSSLANSLNLSALRGSLQMG